MQKRLFSIPDANSRTEFSGDRNVRLINRALLECMEKHPDWFYDDFQIETAYGCPGSCIWNGNRSIGEIEEFDEGWADAVLGMYARYGIKYRVTFTNFLLKPSHLKDKMGNAVALAISKFGGGYVMVSTPLMAEYMAENYPNLEICWSTTTDFGPDVPSQIKKINELSKHNIVVPPYTYNNKFELMSQFAHPENIEFLADEKCIDNCPLRRQHEINCNLSNLYEWDDDNCLRREEDDTDLLEVTHRLSKDIMEKDYLPRGFNHFKLEGRSNPIKWLLVSYCMFWIRDGYEYIIEDFARRQFPDMEEKAAEVENALKKVVKQQ